MISTSTEFNNLINAPVRELTFAVLLNGTDEVPAAEITSIKIQRKGASKNGLLPGEFCKSLLTMETTQNITTSGYITVTCSVVGAADIVPMGKYWLNSIEYDVTKGIYTVKAYDVPPWFDEEAETDSTAVSDILDTIENSSGMTIMNRNVITLTSVEGIAFQDGMTWMQLLGYIAGYHGFSVRTRNGSLQFYLYSATSATTLPASLIYESGMKHGAAPTHIYYYLINNELKVGGGTTGITYENPIITTQEQANTAARYLDTEYTAGTFKVRGNPALLNGDVITVTDQNNNSYRVLVMDLDFVIDGGMYMTIHCYDNSALKSVVGASPMERRMLAMQSTYEKYAQTMREQMLDQLAGNTEGYYMLIDSDGNPVNESGNIPAGFQITDASRTQGWRFLLGGLYHSKDGFQTIDKTAITSEGFILGSAIAANSIATSSLQVDARNAVTNVNTNFTFDDAGMHVAKDGAAYESLFSNAGMRVLPTSGGDSNLIAEGDSVSARNLSAWLTFRHYGELMINLLQNYYDVVDNEAMSGFFIEEPEEEE